MLDESQLSFIQEEFGHDPDALSALSDEDFEKLYDRLGDIEVEETGTTLTVERWPRALSPPLGTSFTDQMMNLKSKQKGDGYPPPFFFASHSPYKGRLRIHNKLTLEESQERILIPPSGSQRVI